MHVFSGQLCGQHEKSKIGKKKYISQQQKQNLLQSGIKSSLEVPTIPRIGGWAVF